MDRSRRYHLRQMTRDHVTSSKTYCQHVPLIRYTEDRPPQGFFFLIIHDLSLIMRKYQTNPNGGACYKITNILLKSLFKNIKVMKDKESMRNCHRLEDPEET